MVFTARHQIQKLSEINVWEEHVFHLLAGIAGLKTKLVVWKAVKALNEQI